MAGFGAPYREVVPYKFIEQMFGGKDERYSDGNCGGFGQSSGAEDIGQD